MLLQAEPMFVAKGLVLADHRDPADRLLIIKTGAIEVCLAIDSKVRPRGLRAAAPPRRCCLGAGS